MTILVWIYRLVTFFLLFVLATNALVRFVALSPFGEVGRYLLLAANILLFVVILATGLRIRIQSKIVWSATLIWSLLFFWWAWIETQSSPFILHELHTFDPEETRLEIRHFQI